MNNVNKRAEILATESKDNAKRNWLVGGYHTGVTENGATIYGDILIDCWDALNSNNWLPNEVDLTGDIAGYKDLPETIKKKHICVLAGLNTLDTVQMANVPLNIMPFITLKEALLPLNRQAFEEAVHTNSYGEITRALYNHDELLEYSTLPITDPVLKDRTSKIASLFQDVASKLHKDSKDGNIHDRDIVKMLFLNQVLEGIFFYSGFLFMYALKEFVGPTLHGSTKMIQFINRDEDAHIALYRMLIGIMNETKPEVFTEDLKQELKDIALNVTKLELEWTSFLLEDETLEIPPRPIMDYVKSRANIICNSAGIENIFDGVDDINIPWLQKYEHSAILSSNPLISEVLYKNKVNNNQTQDFKHLIEFNKKEINWK